MTCGDLWYTISIMNNTNITKLQNHKFTIVRGSRSVSSMLTSVQIPFDRAGIAAKKALERNVTPQVIIAEWEEKGRKSRQAGIALHDHITSVLVGKPQPLGLEALSSKSPHMEQFDLFWEKANGLYSLIWFETTVSSQRYMVVGRIDALLLDNEKQTFHVVDWKSGSFSHGWNQLKSPFTNLRDSSITLGALQSAIYRLIVEQETEVELGESYLVHISEESHRIDALPDERKRVEAWLRRTR